MSLTSVLQDAVRAIRDKIQTTAGSASPEDLAYMSKALEAIGGRVSLIEVEDYAQQKITDMTAAANAASAAYALQANNGAAALAAQTTASTAAVVAALNNSPTAMFLAYAAGR